MYTLNKISNTTCIICTLPAIISYPRRKHGRCSKAGADRTCIRRLKGVLQSAHNPQHAANPSHTILFSPKKKMAVLESAAANKTGIPNPILLLVDG